MKYAKTGDVLRRRDALYQRAMDQGRSRAKAADPATAGMMDLVNNWGNDDARKAWDDAWARSSRILKIGRRIYGKVEHDANHGDTFRPMWCDHCQKGGN